MTSRRSAIVALAAAVLVGGCAAVSEVLPSSALECGGTESVLCGAVATLAVAQMNLTATGPITHVTLTPADCTKLGRSNFHAEWRLASACWEVEVTGERSHGGGVIVRQPDGTLEPFW